MSSLPLSVCVCALILLRFAEKRTGEKLHEQLESNDEWIILLERYSFHKKEKFSIFCVSIDDVVRGTFRTLYEKEFEPKDYI